MHAVRTHQEGFTLIETLMYAGLLAALGAVLTLAGVRIIRQNAHAQLTAQVLGNARGVLEDMSREVRHGTGVYVPTSVFASHPGQLSLATREKLPADEKETYVEFYVDDERIYRKREGAAAELLTSEQVKVTNLVFTHLNSSNDPAIRIEMTVVPVAAATAATSQASIKLTTTASLRAI